MYASKFVALGVLALAISVALPLSAQTQPSGGSERLEPAVPGKARPVQSQPGTAGKDQPLDDRRVASGSASASHAGTRITDRTRAQTHKNDGSGSALRDRARTRDPMQLDKYEGRTQGARGVSGQHADPKGSGSPRQFKSGLDTGNRVTAGARTEAPGLAQAETRQRASSGEGGLGAGATQGLREAARQRSESRLDSDRGRGDLLRERVSERSQKVVERRDARRSAMGAGAASTAGGNLAGRGRP
jgi:hypothetical protein